MDTNEQYGIDAARTLSGEFFGDRVGYDLLIHRLQGVEVMGKAIDREKRLLYYGVAPEPHECVLPPVGVLGAKNEQILHGILGLIGEAAELVPLAIAILHGKEIDETNLIEEIGDCQWFSAITMGALGKTLTAAQIANIAKLRKRYPNKFTLDAAVNRDLFAERAALEGSELKVDAIDKNAPDFLAGKTAAKPGDADYCEACQ